MGWLSRDAGAAPDTGGVLDGAPEPLAAPGAPAGPGPADPFSYPTWLTAFSPRVLCDILVECLVLLAADLIVAAIAHRPALWRRREAVRGAELALEAAERTSSGGERLSAPGGAEPGAPAASDVQRLRADLERGQRDYAAALQTYEDGRRGEAPLVQLSRSYATSLAVGYVLGALHDRLYMQRYRKGVTWLFVFPEGVIPRGFLSWLLALGTGRKEPGVVGYFVARRVLNRPLRRLASKVFPPFAPAMGPTQAIGGAIARAMADSGVGLPVMPGGAAPPLLGASRRNSPGQAPAPVPRPPRIPARGNNRGDSETTESQPAAQPVAEPVTG